MKQIVVLGNNGVDMAMSYLKHHAIAQTYFTFIGDENADENFMRDEDTGNQLQKAGLQFTCRKSKGEPQDCHALVYADEVLLVDVDKRRKQCTDYLKAVFLMRAKTNAGQPLTMWYRKEEQEQALCLLKAVHQTMQEEGSAWFHQMVKLQEL